MEEILLHFQTICNLSTRQLEPSIPLPDTLTPAPHMQIIDLQLFITTALTRLESDSPRLRGIALRSLMAVKNSLLS